MQQDLQQAVVPEVTVDMQRSALWLERQAEEGRRRMEERKRQTREVAFDEMMRRGNMLDAHREVLRKMQADANRHL